jgi:hypothetical protein
MIVFDLPGVEVNDATSLLSMADLIVDGTGRRWCMIGNRSGFTRDPSGNWLFARRGDHPFLTDTHQPVTSISTIAALDDWETAHIPTDTDPTPAHGVARPALPSVAR